MREHPRGYSLRSNADSGPVLANQLDASGALRLRAVARVPGGVHSNVRLDGPATFIKRARGAWLYSVDGDDYVDYLLGQGPNFLGHAPEFLTSAVYDASREGLIYGGQGELEVRAAEILCEALGWADMVRFGVTGTEAVQAALRLARAVTGRSRVIRFEGHYHGWLDNLLIAKNGESWGTASAGQLASHLDDFTILPWNDADLLAQVLDQEGDQVAAVIMEPVMINTGVIEPQPGYLERVRRLCSQHGIVLIFDEVISGFRLGPGGAVGRFGVVPDLATYGKAIGGGYPVSALVGGSKLMRRLGTGEVNHAGTFNASVPAMAALIATLERLRDNPPYAAIGEHGRQLMDGIRGISEELGEPLRVEGLPMAFHVSFGDNVITDHRSLQRLDLARYADLANALVQHGIWVARRGVWYVSAAHGPGELDEALTRFKVAYTDWLG